MVIFVVERMVKRNQIVVDNFDVIARHMIDFNDILMVNLFNNNQSKKILIFEGQKEVLPLV